MKHLKRLLRKPLHPVPAKVIAFPLLFALAGFIDATFLSFEHFRNIVPPCSIGSCETVLTSSYSVIFGIPVSLLGVLYYLALLIGLFLYIDLKHAVIARITLSCTIFGFAMSMWFVAVQAFILHSYCLYCMASATISTLLLLSALYVFKTYRHDGLEPEIK